MYQNMRYIIKIDMEQRFRILDKILISQNLKDTSLGLFNGKMGVCIYFFHLAQQTNNKEYQLFAEHLLDDIYNSISDGYAIDFDNGLAGIAWGINYLIKKKFVEGNINSIFQDIDDKIVKIISFEWFDKLNSSIELSQLIMILFYFLERLKTQSSYSIDKYIFQGMVIQIINKIERDAAFSHSKWEPSLIAYMDYILPIYLYILSDLFLLDFYNYKIIKIIDGISATVLSSIPQLHCMRLFLLLGVRKVLTQIHIPEWTEYANLLEKNIDHNRIINKEFRNKNIYLNTGICGYSFLLYELDKCTGSNMLELQKDIILKKITNANIWNDEFNPESGVINNIGLLNGFTGVALTYQLLFNSNTHED